MSPAATNQQANANAYLRTRVLTATPEELRLMLLDGAIKFARQGREAMERNDHEGLFSGVSQCRNIVFELLTTIRADVDATLAQRVRSLYTFLYAHLTEANLERSASKMDTVIELLEYERETWRLLMDRLASERSGAAAPPPRPAHAAISVEG